MFLAKCLSKCPSSMKPPLPWKMSGCMPALKHYLFSKTFHLKCLTGFWINFCIDNGPIICGWPYAVYCIRHIQNSGILKTRYIWTCSDKCRIIKAYSSILRYFKDIFRLIQAYSAPCVILAYWQHFHISSPSI